MQGSFFQNIRSKVLPYCFFLILSLPRAVPDLSSYPRVKQSNVQNKTAPPSFQTGASTRLHNKLVQCTSLLYTTPLILICRGRRLTCENWGPAKQTKHLHILLHYKPTDDPHHHHHTLILWHWSQLQINMLLFDLFIWQFYGRA